MADGKCGLTLMHRGRLVVSNIKCDSDLLMIKNEPRCSKSPLLCTQQQAGILKHFAARDLF